MIYYEKDHILNKSGLHFNTCGNYPILHSHTYWEFIFISANTTQIINGYELDLPPNSALIIRPADNHKFINSQNVISQSNFKIADWKLHELTNAYDENLYDLLINEPKYILFTLKNSDVETLKKLTQTMMINPDSRINTSLMMSAVTIILNCYINEIYAPSYIDKNYSQCVQLIIEKMSSIDNFKTNLSLLTKNCGYSYMQLSRIFKKETTKNMKEYFNDLKMHYAANILINSTEKIIDIAHSLGFDTQSHFGKVFLKYYGTSPKEYRKKHKEKFSHKS